MLAIIGKSHELVGDLLWPIAFGNAIGNSIVGKMNESSQADIERAKRQEEQLLGKVANLGATGFETATGRLAGQVGAITTQIGAGGQAVLADIERINGLANAASINLGREAAYARDSAALAALNALSQIQRTDIDQRTAVNAANRANAQARIVQSYQDEVDRGMAQMQMANMRMEPVGVDFSGLGEVDLSTITADKVGGSIFPRKTEEQDVDALVRDLIVNRVANTKSTSDATAAVRSLLGKENIPADRILNIGGHDKAGLTKLGVINDRAGFWTMAHRDSKLLPSTDQLDKNFPQGTSASEVNSRFSGTRLFLTGANATVNAWKDAAMDKDRVTAFHMFEDNSGVRYVEVEGFFQNTFIDKPYGGEILKPDLAVYRLGLPKIIDDQLYVAPRKWYE